MSQTKGHKSNYGCRTVLCNFYDESNGNLFWCKKEQVLYNVNELQQ